ncbi:uncharacterized protein M6D78_016590 [Vipera latastei]
MNAALRGLSGEGQRSPSLPKPGSGKLISRWKIKKKKGNEKDGQGENDAGVHHPSERAAYQHITIHQLYCHFRARLCILRTGQIGENPVLVSQIFQASFSSSEKWFPPLPLARISQHGERSQNCKAGEEAHFGHCYAISRGAPPGKLSSLGKSVLSLENHKKMWNLLCGAPIARVDLAGIAVSASGKGSVLLPIITLVCTRWPRIDIIPWKKLGCPAWKFKLPCENCPQPVRICSFEPPKVPGMKLAL